MTLDMQSGPQRVTLEAGEAFARAAAESTPSTPVDEPARCLSCHRPLTAPRSIGRGFGPECFTREANRQRHERAAALHGRLRDLLRRVPSLDVRELALVSAALDAAVDALEVTA